MTDSRCEIAGFDGKIRQEDVVQEIERVSKELGKRPTTTEFDEHSKYKSSDVYSHFDSWDDAIEASTIETLHEKSFLMNFGS